MIFILLLYYNVGSIRSIPYLDWLFWANFILGCILALMAIINWLGTDRSHEIYELGDELEKNNSGYSLAEDATAQSLLEEYDTRSYVFISHILFNILLGFIGWLIAREYIYIPAEP